MAVRKFIVALLVGLVLAVGGALSAVVAVGEESARAGATELADVDWAAITPGELEKMILAGELHPTKAEKVKPTEQGHIRTPITWVAIDSDNPDLIDVLVKHGADVNWADEETGLTALHFAVYRGKFEMAKKLIKHGADIGKRDKIDFAPAIFMSLKLGDSQKIIRMIELLLGHGANLHVISEPQDKRLSTNLLIEVVARIVDSPSLKEKREFESVLNYLVNQGRVDVDATPHGQLTAMHFIVLHPNDDEIIRKLSKLGGDVNVAHLSGLTPLMNAVANTGNLASIKTLIDLGANVGAKDIKGQTAIDYARMRSKGDFDFGYISGRYAEYFSSLDEWRNFGVQAEEILLKHIDEEKTK